MQKSAIFSECAPMDACNSLLLVAFSNDNTFGTKQMFYFKIAYKYLRHLWTEMLKQWSTGVKIQKVYKQLFTFFFLEHYGQAFKTINGNLLSKCNKMY